MPYRLSALLTAAVVVAAPLAGHASDQVVNRNSGWSAASLPPDYQGHFRRGDLDLVLEASVLRMDGREYSILHVFRRTEGGFFQIVVRGPNGYGKVFLDVPGRRWGQTSINRPTAQRAWDDQLNPGFYPFTRTQDPPPGPKPPEVVEIPELRNPSSKLCVSSNGRAGEASMTHCQVQKGGVQAWSFTPATGELKNPAHNLCLDSFGRAGPAMMHPCHGNQGNQQWTWDRNAGQWRNPSSGLCLDSFGVLGPVQMHPCHGQRGNQEFR